MPDQELEYLPLSDHHQIAAQTLAMAHLPLVEVTQMHIFHHPTNANDVNGFTFVIRDAEEIYTLSIRQGANGDGIEQIDAVPYKTGDVDYIKIVESRGEALEFLEKSIAGIGPSLKQIMVDLKE
ncbi:MAG: hypothetical protein WBG32_03155 [Nodosilinea sp.]